MNNNTSQPTCDKEKETEVVEKTAAEKKRTESEGSNPESYSPQIEFKPIVQLPLVEVKTLEEEEHELLKLRAKLYCYETSEEPAEWKERGLGDVKFLQNKETSAIRILMRREKTLKMCANHNVTPSMKLSQHANNDKAFVWSTFCDFSDGEAKPQTFCIRFGSLENAQKFKKTFEDAKETAASIKSLYEKIASLAVDDEEEDSSDSCTDEEGEQKKSETDADKKEVDAQDDDDDDKGKNVPSSVNENETCEADDSKGNM